MRARGSEQHHWLRLSSHILQENINAEPLEASENRGTLHFLDNKKTSYHSIFSYLVLEELPWALMSVKILGHPGHSYYIVIIADLTLHGFLQHWMCHLTDGVHYLSRADCAVHISLRLISFPISDDWWLISHVGVPGERATDVDMFAKEEGVISRVSMLSLCSCWNLLFFSSTLPARKRGLKTQVMLTGEVESQGWTFFRCNVIVIGRNADAPRLNNQDIKC